MGAKRKFDWDHANRDHLAEHDVTPEEFEQIFDHPRFERTVERKGEKRKWCLGKPMPVVSSTLSTPSAANAFAR
ncbi:MAG TPA: hypothetical protein VN633_00920 [Bryobacteraceae bacterium]|nr:hypothetical protein [Bryobacteraceae bacterium]